MPIVLTLLCIAAVSDVVPVLHHMQDKADALCLDGSPAAFSYQEGSSNQWVIFFQGGAWCYTEDDCLERAQTDLGSSNNLVAESHQIALLSNDCTANPDFCTHNKVFVYYCDGTSFTGNLVKPISHNGTELYFRGNYIRTAVLETLAEQYGFNSAEKVLVSGFSAGGAAVYLHSNQINDWVVNNVAATVEVKAVSLAGMFLDVVSSTTGVRVWHNEMQYLANMANLTGGLDQTCVAVHGWECIFPLISYQFIRIPIFVVNSAVDEYMVANMAEATLPVGFPSGDKMWIANLASLPCYHNDCTDTSDPQYAFYARRFLDAVNTTEFMSSGNGAFIFACVLHGEVFVYDRWTVLSVNGVDLRTALGRWMNGETVREVDIHLGQGVCLAESPALPTWVIVSGVVCSVLCAVLAAFFVKRAMDKRSLAETEEEKEDLISVCSDDISV